MPAFLAPVIAWFGSTFAAMMAWMVTALFGQVIAGQAAEAAARLARLLFWTAAIVTAVNLLIPGDINSLSGLWTTYSAGLGTYASWIGFFVPIPLLLTLLDLYIAALLVLFTIQGFRRVAELTR